MRTCLVPGRAVRRPLRPLQAEQVVAVHGPAVLHVKAPAGEGPALGDDHALDALLGHLELRRDGV